MAIKFLPSLAPSSLNILAITSPIEEDFVSAFFPLGLSSIFNLSSSFFSSFSEELPPSPEGGKKDLSNKGPVFIGFNNQGRSGISLPMKNDRGPINIFIPPLNTFHIFSFIGTHPGIQSGGSSGKSGIFNLGIPS